ncbi:MAG TPA: ATP-binding protein [Candidatus Elarobacter sp.]
MNGLEEIRTLQQLEELSEGIDFEAKAAQGKTGRGAVPDSVWETYSSFANTAGGLIALGVAENQANHSLTAVGLTDPEKVRRDFVTTVNSNRVSRNILSDDDIRVVDIEGVSIVLIAVPRASRTERPVHVGPNPLSGTFRRMHDGDQRCDEQTVKAMMADALAEDRSAKVVANYSLDDFEDQSVRRYRSLLASVNPESDLLSKDRATFLRTIGAAALDRDTRKVRPTLAGLVMFGEHAAIVERLPNFSLDYRRIESSAQRYVDRVHWDGNWSGNLFDFYTAVAPRLFRGVPRGFALNQEMQRIDDTSIQVALREALVNAIIHADYELPGGVVIVQALDRFHFRNPGMMRVPVEQALLGGISDCRNARLQQMFRLVGFAEQIGSGVPRIFETWLGRSWQRPDLHDAVLPDRTELTMLMTDFLPPSVAAVIGQMGSDADIMTREEKYVLGMALLNRQITNRDVRLRAGMHARDVTVLLAQLVSRNLLQRHGRTTAAHYTPGTKLIWYQAFANAASKLGPDIVAEDTRAKPPAGGNVGVSPESDIVGSKVGLGPHPNPARVPQQGEQSLFDLPRLDFDESVVDLVRDSNYADKDKVEQAIIALCSTEPRGVRELGTLLRRNPDYMQRSVGELVERGLLKPTRTPRHPRQKYTVAPPKWAAETELAP